MALFSWFRSKQSQDAANPIATIERRPNVVDFTNSIKVNGDLARGVFHNSYPGFKLAGALAYAPIATPVAFMGWPIVTGPDKDKATQAVIDEINEQFQNRYDAIHTESHVAGSVWVYPSIVAGKLRWEEIPDDSCSDIIEDLKTGEIMEVIFTEQISYKAGENDVRTIDRKRSFRPDRVTIDYGGALPKETFRNPFGIMPVPFINGEGRRGHSDLERIIPDLKSYHDVKLNWAETLSKFRPKWVQEVKDVTKWKETNTIDSFTDFDIGKRDLVINLAGQEKTDVIFLQGASEEFKSFLEFTYYNILQGSGIPEICWGLATTGNHASAEENMSILVKFCKAKQSQHTGSWDTLYRYSLILKGVASMRVVSSDITTTWDELTALSEETKAKIFDMFAKSVAALIGTGAPMEFIHKTFIEMYPSATESDFELFKAQWTRGAKYKQFLDASYTDALDAAGLGDETNLEDTTDLSLE